MIRAEQLSFRIGDFHLRDFNLEVARGTYFVMLGPPGSGKTVFLECLCGLRRPDAGRIFIDARDVTTLEPRARPIGYVPQDYALFPHLSVERNIAFGLRTRNHTDGDIAKKVSHTAEMLGITALLKRRVTDLSGGEKQRTALARALVLEPKVLLLDEPVCALDEGTRQRVCSLLHRVQRELDLTVMHVSHNLEEAFSVADKAGILDKGILKQVGSLDALLRHPDSEFVARFMRCENIIPADAPVKPAEPLPAGAKMMIRPEDVLVLPASRAPQDAENRLPVTIAQHRDFGGYVKVELSGQIPLTAHLTHAAFAALNAEPNTKLTAILPPQNIHSFNP